MATQKSFWIERKTKKKKTEKPVKIRWADEVGRDLKLNYLFQRFIWNKIHFWSFLKKRSHLGSYLKSSLKFMTIDRKT